MKSPNNNILRSTLPFENFSFFIQGTYTVNCSSHFGFEELLDFAVFLLSPSTITSVYIAVPNQFFFLFSLALETNRNMIITSEYMQPKISIVITLNKMELCSSFHCQDEETIQKSYQ